MPPNAVTPTQRPGPTACDPDACREEQQSQQCPPDREDEGRRAGRRQCFDCPGDHVDGTEPQRQRRDDVQSRLAAIPTHGRRSSWLP